VAVLFFAWICFRLLLEGNVVFVGFFAKANIGFAAVDLDFLAGLVKDLDLVGRGFFGPGYVDFLACGDVVAVAAFVEMVVGAVVVGSERYAAVEDENVGYRNLLIVVLVNLRIPVFALVVEAVVLVVFENRVLHVTGNFNFCVGAILTVFEIFGRVGNKVKEARTYAVEGDVLVFDCFLDVRAVGYRCVLGRSYFAPCLVSPEEDAGCEL